MLSQFDDVITRLLTRCWRGFYELRGNGTREFQRDLPRLRMALLRYGKACADRGWEFDLAHFEGALVKLLNDVLTRADQVRYLPMYLQNAVDRHIDQQAEKLNDKAKREQKMDRVVGKVLSKVERMTGELVTGPRPVSATELAAQLYAKLRADSKAKAMERAAKRRKQRQPEPAPKATLAILETPELFG